MSIYDSKDTQRRKKDNITVIILLAIAGIIAAYFMFTCGFGDWIVKLAN